MRGHRGGRNRGARENGRENGRNDSRAPPAANRVRRPAGLKQKAMPPRRPSFGGRQPTPSQAPPKGGKGGFGQGQWVFVPAGKPIQSAMPQRGRMNTVSFRQGLKQKALKMTGQAGSKSSSSVRIDGFDYGTSEDDVRTHCEKVGKVMKVELRGEKGGWAIVTFSKPASAEKAMKELAKTTIEGNERYINVKKHGGGGAAAAGGSKKVATVATRKRKRDAPLALAGASDGCVVRVRGFDKGTELDAIVDHCSSAGTITDSKLLKRFAFLTYSSKDEASVAADTLEKSTIPGNERYIEVKLYEPKGDAPRNQDNGKQRKKKEGPTGPDLKRDVVDGGATMTGKILRVLGRGKFGFIKANSAIDHPDADKHKGDIYFHIKDVEGGDKLKPDMEVEFILYSDADGLGAQQIRKL